MAELRTRHQRKKHKRSLRRNGGLHWVNGARQGYIRNELLRCAEMREALGLFAAAAAFMRMRARVGAK